MEGRKKSLIPFLDSIEETITIPVEEYNHLLKLKGYIQNWDVRNIWECPKCGTYNPEGYICIECKYDNSSGI